MCFCDEERIILCGNPPTIGDFAEASKNISYTLEHCTTTMVSQKTSFVKDTIISDVCLEWLCFALISIGNVVEWRR